MWWYLSGVLVVLIIWILLDYIRYRKNDGIEITSSEIVFGSFIVILSWAGLGASIIGFLILWGLQNETVFNFEKKNKKEDETDR